MLSKAYIEITTFCGLNCDFCEPNKSKPYNMKLSLFEKINKELQDKTKTIAYHILGDPITVQNLSEYLDISAKYGHSVELTTSGHTLEQADKNILLHPAIRQINFSLSSYFANTNKADNLESYMRHIMDFCELSIGAPKRFVNLRLWNIGNDSYGVFNTDIERILKERFGVGAFSAKKTRLAPYTLLVKDKMFEWPSLSKEALSSVGSCLAISGQIGFLANGRVVPCCLDANADMELGDMKVQSIDEALNSDKAQRMLRGFKENILLEKMCQTCGFREVRL